MDSKSVSDLAASNLTDIHMPTARPVSKIYDPTLLKKGARPNFRKSLFSGLTKLTL